MKFLMIITLAILAGCQKPATSDSALNVDGGIRVYAQDGDPIPAVVHIGGCTATAVSDNTLLTAAHCVQDKICIAGSITSSMGKGVCALQTIIAPGYRTGDSEGSDIAIGIFPPKTFTHYFPVSLKQEAIGAGVMMVGYSLRTNYNQMDAEVNDGKGSKRWGRNMIKGNSGPYETYQSAGLVALSQGDSGGPLFNKQCQWLGAASTRGGTRSAHSNGSQNVSFMKQQEAKGAYYCGESGNDPNKCGGSLAVAMTEGQKTSDGREVFPCSSGGGVAPTPAPGTPNSLGSGNIALNLNDKKTGSALFPALEVGVGSNVSSIKVCYNQALEACKNDAGKTFANFTTTSKGRKVVEVDPQFNASVMNSVAIIGNDGSQRYVQIKAL